MLKRIWPLGFATLILLGTQLAASQAQQMTILHNFCTIGKPRHCKDAFDPNGVMQDPAGNLFGVTSGGWIVNKTLRGTIYEMVGGTKYQTLYTFCPDKVNCTDGQNPFGQPIMDVAGNLYGVTGSGGNYGGGVVFELVRTGDQWTYRKLYDFCSQAHCDDGGIPSTGLTYAGAASGAPYDGSSPLYGATIVGGVVFQLTPGQGGAWQEKVLHTFEQNGSSPSNLLLDGSGRLFGTTDVENGAVFELSPNGDAWDYSVVYAFCSQPNCADGARPSSPLVEDANGALFGLTFAGGIPCNNSIGNVGCGVVFKLTPRDTHWKETVLYAFCQQADCSDGASPDTNLKLDPAGNLFGTTYSGGGNDAIRGGGGTVFELALGKRFRKLYSFCAAANCADGASPSSGLLVTPQHNLIGDTIYGGSTGEGVLYELRP